LSDKKYFFLCIYSKIKKINSNSDFAGGIIGYNVGGGQINRSYSYGSISGLGIIGGIVGEAEVDIISSAAIVDLDGFVSIGGLAGWISYSEIQDCYSHGTVTADSQVGGFVGLSNFTNISKSYSATIVNADIDSGGFSSTNEGNIEDCYWNIDIANQQIGNYGGNSAGLTGLTTEQMTGTNALDNMVELDFTTIWKLTDSYPVLEWEYSVDFLLKPYLTTPEDQSSFLIHNSRFRFFYNILLADSGTQ